MKHILCQVKSGVVQVSESKTFITVVQVWDNTRDVKFYKNRVILYCKVTV